MILSTKDLSGNFSYDGCYFSFTDNDEEDEKPKDPLSYFTINTNKVLPNVLSSTHPVGDTFLMAFLKFDEEGIPVFDGMSEAILGDPDVYMRNLAGSGLFGCIVRKTPRGEAWFDEHYVQNAHKVIDMAKNRLKTQN
jgi:hypothetical protein